MFITSIMKIKLLVEYQITTTSKVEKELDISGLTKYLEKQTIESKADLEWEIANYLDDTEAFNCFYERDVPEDRVEDSEFYSIENMEELVDHFKYLIKDVK